MKTMYRGEFTSTQFEQYKEKLHDKMFWLLLYKDPKTKDQFANVDFNRYFENLMRELTALNHLLMEPPSMIELLSVLQAAYEESNSADFDYKEYRKFVLDAHTLLDKMGVISDD